MRSKSASYFQVVKDRQHKPHFLKQASQRSLGDEIDVDGGSSLGDPSYISDKIASSNLFGDTYGSRSGKNMRRKEISPTKCGKTCKI